MSGNVRPARQWDHEVLLTGSETRPMRARVDGGPARELRAYSINGHTVVITPVDGPPETYRNADFGLFAPEAVR